MINRRLALLALRGQLLGVEVCTTGSTSLSATTTGYARAAGSFVTDGFEVGHEIVAAGFTSSANNGKGIITELTATAMTIGDAYNVSALNVVTPRIMVADAAASGRTISVSIPAMRAWENTKLKPVTGKPYLEEDFVPATSRLRTIPADNAFAEDTGLYVVRWFGLSDTGAEALSRCADAVLEQFTPGTSFLMSDGNTLRIPVELGPKAGQITPIAGGWSYVTIEVPYVGESINAVAA